MKAHPDRGAVEAQIRAAFAGVTLGKGMSLRQAQVADRYGEGVTDAEYEALPRGERSLTPGRVFLSANWSVIASRTWTIVQGVCRRRKTAGQYEDLTLLSWSRQI